MIDLTLPATRAAPLLPPPALSDTAVLRARAHASVTASPHSDVRRADRAAVADTLNQALATELVSVLRYKRHAFTAQELAADPIAAEFEKHASEEQGHADQIAARICQLDGEPDFSPTGLAARAHSEYDASAELVHMIRADLIAERIDIDAYGEAIRFVGDGDATTRRMLESILAMEEEHAADMADLLAKLTVRPA